MTDDEMLINSAWPQIRDTVTRVLPKLDEVGWGQYVRGMSVRDQMDFWMLWKRVEECPMPEITAVARETRKVRAA